MRIPKLKSRHFLTITDLERDEIFGIFGLTQKLKKNLKNGKHKEYLKNKTLAMIFEKSSTRTRVSFETGIQQLGGFSLFLSNNDIQLGRGESLQDTARVLSRYVDAIMMRTFSHEKLLALAGNAKIPVINGLSDAYHPCQSLADFFTIFEREKDISKVKLAYIGDGNNVANSLLLGASQIGVDISIATPEEYRPLENVIDTAKRLSSSSGANIHISDNINEAIENAHYLYTDVWISMGQEDEAEKRKKAFKDYRVTKEMLKKCFPGCRVMHCLPAHRGEEIESDVMDSEQSVIFEQAENRLHVQKAVMCALMK